MTAEARRTGSESGTRTSATRVGRRSAMTVKRASGWRNIEGRTRRKMQKRSTGAFGSKEAMVRGGRLV